MSTNANPTSADGLVKLSDEDGVRQIVVDTVFKLWDAVHNLTRLRPTRRERYRVTIFGSARCCPGTPVYDETKKVAQALANLGCDIVTGGGPGLMQAANEGAAGSETKVHSTGIRVQLPFEQNVNAFVTEAYEHRTFFSRLHQFVLMSDAYIVAPGGVGTLLETVMVWQLLQVNHVERTPLILVGKMWPGLIEWARSAMTGFDPPLANDVDFTIPVCVENSEGAIKVIADHHAEWMKQSRQESTQ